MVTVVAIFEVAYLKLLKKKMMMMTKSVLPL